MRFNTSKSNCLKPTDSQADISGQAPGSSRAVIDQDRVDVAPSTPACEGHVCAHGSSRLAACFLMSRR